MLRASKNSRTKLTVGIDIGASKIEWAVLSKSKIESDGRIDIHPDSTNEDLREIVNEIINKSNAKLAGIGVAGFVQNNIVLQMPNLPKIKDLDFSLQNTFIENDLKCAALAYWWSRGRSKQDSFVAISAGSGIGGAIVQDGKLIRGKDNLAGEFGHMKIPFAKPRGLPALVDWEKLAGGRGVEQNFYAIIKGRSSISSKKYDFEGAKEIFESDSPLAKRVCVEGAFYFGVGIANIANALAPNEIILSGSVAKAYMNKYKKEVLNAYSQGAIAPLQDMNINVSKFSNPTLIGSILLTRQKSNKKVKEFLN